MASDDDQKVRVLGVWNSPFSAMVKLALKLKGVQYEYIEEDLQNKSPLLLESNPVHKKIPVLIHGRKPVAESVVILEYINETWPENPLLPNDPYERAQARFWAKFIEEKCGRAIWTAYGTQGEEKEKAIKDAEEGLKILEEGLKGKFFNGETIGFLDIVACGIAFWLPVLEEAADIKFFDPEKLPRLRCWTEEYTKVELVKEAFPPRDKLLPAFKAYRDQMFGPKDSST
ncbi:hypothetical protein AMTRI_Chr09g39290 [Amborella trichopoda]